VKLLIAEDDRDTREGLKEIFTSEGYEVFTAADGHEAVSLFLEHRPDLVCLDIMMPGKSGYDACRAIRKADSLVPLLFLSAKSEEIDKVLGLELGADDYVVKPFGVRELTARVKALLRRREAPTEAIPEADFTIADLTVCPGELRAYRGESPIDLSEREVKILQTFAENPGKVISRDTLFDRAWGANYLPSSRTLDQSISQLRKKVETDPASPRIIRTVHSAGYRWDEGAV
jgi:DNA-binding response OmpR family regulator